MRLPWELPPHFLWRFQQCCPCFPLLCLQICLQEASGHSASLWLPVRLTGICLSQGCRQGRAGHLPQRQAPHLSVRLFPRAGRAGCLRNWPQGLWQPALSLYSQEMALAPAVSGSHFFQAAFPGSAALRKLPAVPFRQPALPGLVALQPGQAARFHQAASPAPAALWERLEAYFRQVAFPDLSALHPG